ncbi:multicopper oxidase family protein [Halomarina oriensis]|uniref:Multicopper oxidase CueO n=1 Tax=Halomarina oriensis TaxID=671145 RepID=A0A6B0GLX5_9EURY|nr:multicopper oxidase domain-containing protein [Halomarina oriensis]MWG35650.1 multicopper oxidase domain-containing protein [Halomarina oriensis]
MTDSGLNRRQFVKLGAGLGIAGALPWAIATASKPSPELEKFVQPMPIPEVRAPDGKYRGKDYYEIPMLEVEKQVHPDLPATTMWGFDGEVPGPVIRARQNERIHVRYDNSGLPDEHMFEVDEFVHGTTPEDYTDHDGPVPEVRTSVHQHGLNVERVSDGQARQWESPDGTKGPQPAKEVHELRNRQDRMTATYHDHALGVSRLNNYAGLHGFYQIAGKKESKLNLPSGDYDVPIMLEDKSFDEDGSFRYPDSFVANFAGDTAFVNGAVFPYMEVEPRKYRFRLVNQANGRTFGMALQSEDGHGGPAMYQIAPDHGFLEEVVEVGHHGDLESLVLSPFERAEVVVDFSEYAGETITMTNDAAFPYMGPGGGHGGHGDMDGMDMGGNDSMDMGGNDSMDMGGNDSMDMGGNDSMDMGDDSMDMGDDSMDMGDDSMGTNDSGGMEMGGDGHGGMEMGGDEEYPQIPEVMQFRVADSVSDPDTSADPTTLDLPGGPAHDEQAAVETREMTLGMRMVMDEPDLHVLNGKASYEGGDIARPKLGTTEVWELENTGHHSHPIHMHLVTFDIVGRGHHGMEAPAPNERGPKDIVRVDPGETVRIVVRFDNYAGKYPWHCHVLEHEEHAMMRQFEVVGDEEDDEGADGDEAENDGRGRGRGDDENDD